MKTISSTSPLPAPAFSFASFSWPRYVATLPKGSKSQRLERYKRQIVGPYYHAPKPENAGKGKGFYIGDSSPIFDLRWKFCDEVEGSHITHRGWWADDFQDTKIRGLVFRLPKGRGFLAGWTMGEGMASAIEGEVYDDEIDAARAADDLAERVADEEREFQEAERAREEQEESEELQAALFCHV